MTREMRRNSSPLRPLRENPLVSVVTTNRNSGEFVEETILSVLRQDYEPIELVIVDGASTDHSVEVIRKFAEDPRVKWISEPDEGHMQAVNKGVRMAGGDIIGIQHSTDTYQPGAIRQAVKEFASDPLLAFVGGGIQMTDEHGFTIGKTFEYPPERSVMSVDEIVTFTDYPGIQASFFRRDLLLAVGGFEHSCHTNTMVHYMLEAAKIGARCRRVQTIWGNYRQHSHASYPFYFERNKGFAYSSLRAQACGKNEELYRNFLNAEQIRSLRRNGYEYELLYRIRSLHQIVRAIPVLVWYLWLGGSLLPVARQYRDLAARAMARFVGAWRGTRRAAGGVDTRWYLSAQQGRHLLGSQ